VREGRREDGGRNSREGRHREGRREGEREACECRPNAGVRRGTAWDGELERDRTNVPAAHASNPEVA